MAEQAFYPAFSRTLPHRLFGCLPCWQDEFSQTERLLAQTIRRVSAEESVSSLYID
jgi:hypothetical protein